MPTRSPRAAAIAAAVLLCSPAAAAADPEALARGLAAESWAEREAAHAALLDAGPEAARFVRAAFDSPSPEVRARAAAIAEELDGRRATAARRVTLDFADVDPADAVARLAEAAGVDVRADDSLGRLSPVTARYDDAAFWDVLADLCRRGKWSFRPDGGGALVIEADDATPGPAATAGPALVLAVAARREAAVSYGGDDPATRTLEIDLIVHLEPRFQIGPREFRIDWTAATDAATGLSLLPGDAQAVADVNDMPGTPAAPHASIGRWTAGRLPVTASFDPPPGATTIDLAGRLSGLVGADVGESRLDLSDEGGTATWNVAGEPVAVTVAPSPSRPNDPPDRRRWAVTFAVLRPTPRATEELVIASLGGCELADADGRALTRGTSRTRASVGGGGVGYEIEFIGSADLPPAVLSADLPRRAAWLDVPFELRGLRAP